MRATLFCSALGFLLLADGCGSSCPAKTKLCTGVCADLQTDALNCGACGAACGTGQVCTDGACTVVCPTGSTVCDDLCVDTQTDQANCGGCGQQCPSGQACGGGVCGTACLAGFTVCGGGAGSDGGGGSGDGGGLICSDSLTDPANCGACNSPCLSGSVCNGKGACAETCAAGFSTCVADGGAPYCADFITDNQNCGVCGAPCPSGEVCSASHCATSCAAGYSPCNGVDGGIGTCADFLTDSLNCSACGKACASGQVCTGGTCAESCAAGFNACGGGTAGAPYCADFLTDTANCGGCDKPCPSGQVCNGAGSCAESCAAGFNACGMDAGVPYCANLTDDTNNCGTCGKPCASGAICKASACVETCTSGYNACPGLDGGAAYCADFKTDADNCRHCGDNCGASFEAPGCCNSVCTSLATGDVKNCGVCGNACTGTKPGCCEASCVDESSDVNNCGACGNLCPGGEPGCCSSGCVDESKDINNCGACGTTCKSGTTPGCCLAADGGVCTDLSDDSSNCGACGNVCSSGICLGGNCCSAACSTDTTTNCLGSCDATGACSHPTCNPGYGCDLGASCFTTCASSSDCAPNSGYTCWNPPGGSCCKAVANGATIFVDGKLGADTNCCDTAATACQTITFAMKQIAAAGATGVTISATWNNKPTTRADWAPANGETYPIHLGWGVTLKAPGIFFTPAAGKDLDVFDVYSYKAADTGAVTIEGTSTDYMFIGFNSTQANLTGTTIAVNSGVAAQTAVPLTLSKVWMNGQTEALNLGAGANVSLGPSPVIIGSGASTSNPLASVKSPGSGIYCKGAMGAVATLSDVAGGTGSVLQIDQQDTGQGATSEIGDIYAYDYCNVTLSHSPIFGVPPPCPSPKIDGEGILLQGGATMSLTGATIQCLFNHGFDVGETPVAGLSGSPALTLASTLIQYTGQTGLKVNDGKVGPVTNSTFYHCRFGAVVQNTGSLDLSGGGNTAACNTENEPGAFGVGRANGIGVWNVTTNNSSINASNMAWDANPPGFWSCTDAPANFTAANCTCVSGTCNGNNIAVPDYTDAVSDTNTNANPILLTNPSLQTTYTCD